MPYKVTGLTQLSRLCNDVSWVRILSTFLFWESSRQETGNYMELTRVDDFAVNSFPVSVRGKTTTSATNLLCRTRRHVVR